ncbi:MAG: DUF433 domain-containing protein [Acidobacteriota bacterium]|nr:DUF433 domain-containing protein [Acidobacteriota bacterium]
MIRDTRIAVELLLRKLAEGATVGELLDGYPRLGEDGIRACLAYAADARQWLRVSVAASSPAFCP